MGANWTGLSMALFLPFIFGFTCMRFLWPNARLSIQLGYAYFLGIIMVDILLQLWDALGLKFYFPAMGAILALLTLLALLIARHLDRGKRQITQHQALSYWQRAVWWLFFILIIIRYEGVLTEVILRPLYPWDAWMNWAPKARTWFELKELVPFVMPWEWPEKSVHINAYTLTNPEASTYPPLVPLIQTWTALGLSEWRDNWINIPWLFAIIAFGVAIYGQFIEQGVKPINAIIGLYLLLSIPYLNTHVALAGYADLWMSTFLGLAVMEFVQWGATKKSLHIGLMLVFLAAGIQTKVPGIAWAIMLLTAFLVELTFRKRWLAVILGFLLMIGAIVLLQRGGIVTIPYLGELEITLDHIKLPLLGKFILEYHPVSQYFATNALFLDNWHLLGWGALVLAMSLIWWVPQRKIVHHIGPLIFASIGIIFIVFTFLFTRHYRALVEGTTINRASLHLIPSLFFIFWVLLWGKINKREPRLIHSERKLPVSYPVKWTVQK